MVLSRKTDKSLDFYGSELQNSKWSLDFYGSEPQNIKRFRYLSFWAAKQKKLTFSTILSP
jgi:hypothetical protein